MTVAVWASLGEIFKCFKDEGMVSCNNVEGNWLLDGTDENQYKPVVTRAMQAMRKLRVLKPITNIQQNKDYLCWVVPYGSVALSLGQGWTRPTDDFVCVRFSFIWSNCEGLYKTADKP